MADGKTHKKININVIIILTLIVIFFILRKYSLFILGYVIGTLWMNPDLDILSNPYNRWGPLKRIWKPYQKLGHRSIWTHGYVIGDIIRYLYLSIYFFVIITIIFTFTPIDLKDVYYRIWLFINKYSEYIFFIFIGNVTSSAVHTFTDQLSSGYKKIMNKKRKK